MCAPWRVQVDDWTHRRAAERLPAVCQGDHMKRPRSVFFSFGGAQACPIPQNPKLARVSSLLSAHYMAACPQQASRPYCASKNHFFVNQRTLIKLSLCAHPLTSLALALQACRMQHFLWCPIPPYHSMPHARTLLVTTDAKACSLPLTCSLCSPIRLLVCRLSCWLTQTSPQRIRIGKHASALILCTYSRCPCSQLN